MWRRTRFVQFSDDIFQMMEVLFRIAERKSFRADAKRPVFPGFPPCTPHTTLWPRQILDWHNHTSFVHVLHAFYMRDAAVRAQKNAAGVFPGGLPDVVSKGFSGSPPPHTLRR